MTIPTERNENTAPTGMTWQVGLAVAAVAVQAGTGVCGADMQLSSPAGFIAPRAATGTPPARETS